MRKILFLIFITLITACTQGISEKELAQMTEEAINIALEEVENSKNSDSIDINSIVDEVVDTKQEENNTSSIPSSTSTSTTSTSTTKLTTTTTVPRTTTTTLPWAYFGNYEYDCRSNFNGYECSRSFSDIIYCSSIKENSNCSEYWYPDTLEKYDIYEYNFETIICEYSFSLDNISKCKRFSKGSNPDQLSFFSPDYWCETGISTNCYDYDPGEWTKIDGGYFCKDNWDGLDCYKSSSGSPPAYASGTPDLYCDDSSYSSYNCSEYWYPNELANYEITNSFGSSLLCQRAFNGYSYNDYDCGSYMGGDPTFVYFADYKCTDEGFSMNCNKDYYPSELDDYELTSIGYSGTYVCEKSYRSRCWKYYGGSLSASAGGWVDYYCIGNECSEDDWP